MKLHTSWVLTEANTDAFEQSSGHGQQGGGVVVGNGDDRVAAREFPLVHDSTQADPNALTPPTRPSPLVPRPPAP